MLRNESPIRHRRLPLRPDCFQRGARGLRYPFRSRCGVRAIQALYIDLHQHPELSGHEQQTAAKIAAGLRELGYEVSTGIGGTGVVGLLKNGNGPVILLRTELDALPVEEKTCLPFASTVRTKDDSGVEVGVMHACGHDIHMASFMGTARIMAGTRNRWHGTDALVNDPALTQRISSALKRELMPAK